MRKTNKKGFTLVEMLIVVAIMAIIAAVAVPVIMTSSEKAKAKAIETEVSNCIQAINGAASSIEAEKLQGTSAYANGVTIATMQTVLNASYHPTKIKKVEIKKAGSVYKASVWYEGDNEAKVAPAGRKDLVLNDLNWNTETDTNMGDQVAQCICTDGTWAISLAAATGA